MSAVTAEAGTSGSARHRGAQRVRAVRMALPPRQVDCIVFEAFNDAFITIRDKDKQIITATYGSF